MTDTLATKLNIGCGNDIRDGYVNIDGADIPGVDFRVDLDDCAATPLPFPDDHFLELEMSHVIEHLLHPLPLMQELYRISAPGARLHVKVPYAGHDDAWVDPTHVKAYVPQTFAYFGQPRYDDFDYGYTGDWKVEHCELYVQAMVYDHFGREEVRRAVLLNRNVGKEISVRMVAVKPARPRDKSLQEGVPYAIVRV